MFFFAFRHDHGGAFLDGLFDEVVAVDFFAAQRHEKPFFCTRRESYAILSTVRSSGPMTWRTGIAASECFELHEVFNMREASAQRS